MSGLQRIFLRITPIIMLICFVCFGITHAFQQENQPNITYLTHEIITIDDRNTITTEDDITIDNYSFDFKSYRENINVNILKRSTNNVADLTVYERNLTTFNLIWENGYNFGDGIQTIINIGLLIINTIILPINIVLVPLRIIAGILLTAFTIIGININNETPIINFLNTILDNLVIPLIDPTQNKEGNHQYDNTVWYFVESASNHKETRAMNIQFTTTIDEQIKQYNWITVGRGKIEYSTQEIFGERYTLMNNYEWQNEQARYITVINIGTGESNTHTSTELWLAHFAREVGHANQLTNTTWQFNNTFSTTDNRRFNILFTYLNNETEYNEIIFTPNSIEYSNNNAQVYAYLTYANIGSWTSEDMKYIHIISAENLTDTELAQLNTILNNNATQIS